MIFAPNPDGSYTFEAGFEIDADGENGQTDGRPCYAPVGWPGETLDYLADAGHPGNWWGVVTDSTGTPLIQGPNDPAPGAYISDTSYVIPGFAPSDPRSYLAAGSVPFAIYTKAFEDDVPGIVRGCLVKVTYNGVTVEAGAGDEGGKFGEGSLYLAKLLGIPGNAKSGGVPSGVTWQFFPGIAAPGFELQEA
jgi:hypothetical protein